MELTMVSVLAAAAAVVLAVVLTRAAEWAWFRPRRLERALRAQGLIGKSYRPINGDLDENKRMLKEARAKPMELSHDICSRVSPFFHKYNKVYGKLWISWFGPIPRVTIMDPELIKEIMSTKSGHFIRPKLSSAESRLSNGLFSHEGAKWAMHRRILNPAFHIEKLKQMTPAFSICCDELMNKWESCVSPEGSCELDISTDFKDFTADVISRTAFGSSFEEGRHIFRLQTEQAFLLTQTINSVYIPGSRFLPTAINKRRKQIHREVNSILRWIIEKKEKAIKLGEVNSKDDLLGLLLESNLREKQEGGNSKSVSMTIEDVIEECKLFYFAGHETTSMLLTWTMIVLSMHPEWQNRAREEVFEVFGKYKPEWDRLSHLKVVTMILNEVLRLYSPAIQVTRMTDKDMKVGGIKYPPGVMFAIPVLNIHHDTDIWGKDALEFKPERFADGVAKATKNQIVFLPFGWGPRICIGQNFAMTEAKMCLSRILQKFKFELSPDYVHAPYTVLLLHPQHGAKIRLRKI